MPFLQYISIIICLLLGPVYSWLLIMENAQEDSSKWRYKVAIQRRLCFGLPMLGLIYKIYGTLPLCIFGGIFIIITVGFIRGYYREI